MVALERRPTLVRLVIEAVLLSLFGGPNDTLDGVINCVCPETKWLDREHLPCWPLKCREQRAVSGQDVLGETGVKSTAPRCARGQRSDDHRPKHAVLPSARRLGGQRSSWCSVCLAAAERLGIDGGVRLEGGADRDRRGAWKKLVQIRGHNWDFREWGRGKDGKVKLR
jgi:hypothetical protein